MTGVTYKFQEAQVDTGEVAEIMARFDRDGIAVVRGVLSADECKALRDETDRLLDERMAGGGVMDFWRTNFLPESVAQAPIFRDLLVREPLLQLAKAVLGDDCRYCGSVVVRNGPSTAIDTWHIDLMNHVEFPLPDEVPHHDFRIRMPVQWFTIQVALTDIESVEYGPTQVVPGSHYSGRCVPAGDDSPSFLGRGVENITCRAGDIYLFNHQLWHRGGPNLSDRTRYLLQCQYCQNWTAHRFAAIHRITDEHLEGADERVYALMLRDADGKSLLP